MYVDIVQRGSFVRQLFDFYIRSTQALGYADDIDMIGSQKEDEKNRFLDRALILKLQTH